MMRRRPRAQIPADEDGECDEEEVQGPKIPTDEDGEYDEEEAQDPNTCR